MVRFHLIPLVIFTPHMVLETSPSSQQELYEDPDRTLCAEAIRRLDLAAPQQLMNDGDPERTLYAKDIPLLDIAAARKRGHNEAFENPSSPKKEVYYLEDLDRLLGVNPFPQLDAAAARKRRNAEAEKHATKVPRTLTEFASSKKRSETSKTQPKIAPVFLSDEQKAIAKLVSEGHNVFFTGSAGELFSDPSSFFLLT